MDKFVIEGGYPLSGQVTPAGNKNAALPILAASLLTDEEIIVANVPRIRDVDSMVGLLEDLGVSVSWRDEHELALRADAVRSTDLDEELASRIRASFLLAGPLLARFGEARMPRPGGDLIGRRRLDTHLHAFGALGAEIEANGGCDMRAPSGLRACDIFMDEASVMATENAIMAAALTPGVTRIANAASEPHVQDLARLLVSMGAQIEGIGSNFLVVHGRSRLHGARHVIRPDHIEVGSFMALAAVTGGELRITDTVPDDLRMIRTVFERLGLTSHVEVNDVIVPPEQRLRVKDDVGDAIPKIDDGPWPAFPADLTSIAIAVATQADGTVLIFEKMFENRLFFVDKLISMGARIFIANPHQALVEGPRCRLHGERMESPDIRAGMALLIASLCAEGISEIGNVGQIDRGYERIDDRLRELGARIERVSGDRVPT
jgi:UDP-N-acetylglucosamine 1-carboxyvinyltransferase